VFNGIRTAPNEGADSRIRHEYIRRIRLSRVHTARSDAASEARSAPSAEHAGREERKLEAIHRHLAHRRTDRPTVSDIMPWRTVGKKDDAT